MPYNLWEGLCHYISALCKYLCTAFTISRNSGKCFWEKSSLFLSILSPRAYHYPPQFKPWTPLPTLPGRKSLQHSSQSNMEGKRRCQDPEDRTDEMSFGRPGAPHLSSIRAHLKVAHPCETLYHWTVCANQDTLEPSTYHFQKQGLDKSLQTKMHGDCGLRKTLVGNSAWQNSFVKLLQTYAY